MGETIDYRHPVFSVGYRHGFFAMASVEPTLEPSLRPTYHEGYRMGDAEQDCPVEYLAVEIQQEISRRAECEQA